MPLVLQPFTKAVLDTLPYLIGNKLSSVASEDLQAKIGALIDINSKAENGEHLKFDAGLNTARDCWGYVDTIQAAMQAFEAKLYGREGRASLEGRALLSLLAGEDYEAQSVAQRFQRIKGIQNVLLSLHKSERTHIMREIVPTRSQLSMDFFVVLFQQEWTTLEKDYIEKYGVKGLCLGDLPAKDEANFWKLLKQRKDDWKDIDPWLTYYPNLSEAEVLAIALDAKPSKSSVSVDAIDALIAIMPPRFSRENLEHMLSGSSATEASTNLVPDQEASTNLVSDQEQEKLKAAIQASEQSLRDDDIKREASAKNGRRVITVATTLQFVLLAVTTLSALVPFMQAAFPILTIVSGVAGLLGAMAIGRWGGSAEPCNSFYVTFIGSIMLCASHFIPAASVFYLVQAAGVCTLAGAAVGVAEVNEQGMCGFTQSTKLGSRSNDFVDSSAAYNPLRQEDANPQAKGSVSRAHQ